MKKITVILFVSLFSIPILFAQSEYDEIHTFNEGVISVSVKEVTEDAVKFAYPNEELLNSMSKNQIQKIIFKSGREQVFAEASAFKTVISSDDWENVSISKLESEVKGLFKIGDITVKAAGGALASSSKIMDRAYSKLKMETAMLGANVVLVIEETSTASKAGTQYQAAQTPETHISGIAYSSIKPDFTKFINLIEGKRTLLHREDFIGNNNMNVKIKEESNANIMISNPRNEDGFIYVNAKIRGAKNNDFRVIGFDENKLILLEESKGKITNYILILE